MLLPALVCPGCGSTIVLPYRTFLESTLVEPYWPEESVRLSWVCDVCLTCTSFARDRIYWGPQREFAPPSAERGFWRVRIPCGESSCTDDIVAYTRTFGETSRRLLGAAVATSRPAPTCKRGFAPNADAYPLQIDFVEWTGEQEYLH